MLSLTAALLSVNGTVNSGAYFGVDVSYPITPSGAECFKNSGLTFVVPRGYRSTGVIDCNVCDSIKNAATVGIPTRDTYIFPCPTCTKDFKIQMGELLDHMNSNCKNEWSGRVWLDVEGAQYWLGNFADNQAYYKSMVDACTHYGVTCGVYASARQWTDLFGTTDFVYGSNLPMWYAHYDGLPAFSDYTAFGGWDTPHAKQYTGDSIMCDMDVDNDYSAVPF